MIGTKAHAFPEGGKAWWVLMFPGAGAMIE